MHKVKIFTAIGLALGLMACNVEGALEDLENDLVDSAFKNIKTVAEENGGTAAIARSNVETVIEVTDPNSPIFGASVKVPVGAVPADVKHAAVTIQGTQEQLVLPTEDLKANGPIAVVALVQLPGGTDIVPLVPVNIGVPYAKDNSKPVEQLVLGSVDINKKDGLAIVSGSTSVEASKKVTGDTTSLKAFFMASWEVDYDGGPAPKDTLIYKVTGPDDAVMCVGAADLVSANFGASSILYNATGPSYDFGLFVTSALATALTTTQSGTAQDPANGDATVTPTVAADVTFTCGGRALNGNLFVGTPSLKLTAWTETSGVACTSGCATRDALGSATIVGEITFTTTANETVKVGINGTKTDFQWIY